jgi:cytochrome c oxidase subunit 2
MKIWLPVNRKVRVRITSKRCTGIIFYLPHFRVKMDAVPDCQHYFVFTPTKTTEDYKDELRKYKEYRLPQILRIQSEPMWKAFNFELACAELV